MNIQDALNTQQTFNREQVAWLIHAAFQSGYEHGYEQGQADEAELLFVSASYAHLGDFNAETTWRNVERRKRRQEADADARRLVRLSAQQTESAA